MLGPQKMLSTMHTKDRKRQDMRAA